jgi:hypothetical protein
VSVAHTWGTHEAERALPFPCDGCVERIDVACWRGVTVRAPAPRVFRWLCQLKAAPYSYDWIDNFGRRSPRTLTPGLEALAVGQRVMTIFELVAFEHDSQLTIVTRRFVPRAMPVIAGTYALRPLHPGETRLLVKLVVQVSPGPLGAAARVLLPWGDLVMMRRQLLNLKRLAERG